MKLLQHWYIKVLRSILDSYPRKAFYHTFDHDLYYEFIGDRLENCCANILKQGKTSQLNVLNKNG